MSANREDAKRATSGIMNGTNAAYAEKSQATTRAASPPKKSGFGIW